ncbi:unnamed protein product, partial [Phaeothamnion confervicola]
RNHFLAQYLLSRHQVWASFVGRDGSAKWAGEIPLVKKSLLHPLFLWRAWRCASQNRIEGIIASSLIAGLHGVLLKWLTGLPFWMDEHNVEWRCCYRYGLRSWPLIWLLEAFVLRQADWVTCVSPADRDRLVKDFCLQPARVRVAPNGADLEKLRLTPVPLSGDDGHRNVLFFGVLNYPPNRQAVQTLAQEIAPRAPSNVTFLVAGLGGEDLPARY